jgi:hypothetical protein
LAIADQLAELSGRTRGQHQPTEIDKAYFDSGVSRQKSDSRKIPRRPTKTAA